MSGLKIIFDKLKSNEQFSISAKEIRTLFKLVPELTRYIKMVHITGQDRTGTRFSRPARYELLSSQLNVSARGLSRDEIVREMLTELVVSNGSDWSLRPASSRRLTKEQAKRVEEIVEPLFQAFQMQVAQEETE